MDDTIFNHEAARQLLTTAFSTHMNLFRLGGDVMHLISFVVLLFKIRATRSCAGISLKTQFLFALVFVTRYLDLFWNWASLYLVVMKCIFIGSTLYIIYLMGWKYRNTYNREEERKFNLLYIIVPCVIFALVVNQRFTIWEILWAFSIYLEAVAIIPQLMLLQKTKSVESMTSHYIFCLGAYRALYLVNWIYRAFTEPEYEQWIVWVSGATQTILYCDFFYYYVLSLKEGKRMELPEVAI